MLPPLLLLLLLALPSTPPFETGSAGEVMAAAGEGREAVLVVVVEGSGG